MKLYEIIMLVAICILVVFSAFFSSCEIAYSTVSKIRLKKESEKNNKNALAAISIIDNYPILLSTVLVGNNLVNILISSLGTLVAVRHFGEELGPILSTIILTVVVLIFGEIIPKTFGTKYAYRLSLLYTNIFKFFKAIFYPLSFVINKFVSFLLRNYKEDEPIPTATDEELITIAEELEEEGVIDQDDAELIKSAIDFCDVTAHEIMIPRVDVFAINIDDSTDEILNDELIYKYSRVPVYEDTIDNIIGILNTTELIKKVLSNEPIDIKDIKELENYKYVLSYENKTTTKRLGKILNDYDINLDVVLRCPTTEQRINAAKRGIGIAYVMKEAAKSNLKNKKVYEVKLPIELPENSIKLIYLKDRLTKVDKKFIKDYLK